MKDEDDGIDDAAAGDEESIGGELPNIEEKTTKQLPNVGRRLGQGVDGFNAMTPILVAMLLFLVFSSIAQRRRKKNTKVSRGGYVGFMESRINDFVKPLI